MHCTPVPLREESRESLGLKVKHQDSSEAEQGVRPLALMFAREGDVDA